MHAQLHRNGTERNGTEWNGTERKLEPVVKPHPTIQEASSADKDTQIKVLSGLQGVHLARREPSVGESHHQ